MFKRTLAINRLVAAGALLAGLSAQSQAQSTWNGSVSGDWNNAANWSAGVPTAVEAFVNTNSPNIATITTTFSAAPTDIRIGVSAGANARVDHRSGTALTGEGNWLFIGYLGANATYNFADTSTTGGALTGFGQGSGDLNVGGSLQNGNIMLGLDNGTVSTLNINSSGTLSAGGLMVGGSGTASGTVNIDSGTVNISGETQFGSSYYGNGFYGRMNMSGGNFTSDVLSFSRGSSPAASIAGVGNFTGGTINAKRFFTVGFAGSATSTAMVTNNGATINVNTIGGGNFEMGVWDPMTTRFVQNAGAVTVQNSGSIVFGVLGQSGNTTFDHNNGPVTFYSDNGLTVGGFGGIVLGSQGTQPWEISSGTFTYNLNGGTLTVPIIRRTSPNAIGIFNFNGGTLKPTTSLTTFLEGISAANILAGGANIDTDGYDITIGQGIGGTGGLVKKGLGTLTLAGTNTFTGLTVISNGTLSLTGNGSLAGQVLIPAGITFDVSTVSGGIVQNPMAGVGTVNGSVVATPSVAVYPGTDGTVGTLTFANDLDLSAGGSLRFDLSTSHLGGNDQVAVTGNLVVGSSTVIRIKALSGAAALSQVGNYVLCSVTGTTTLTGTPALAWDGVTPANYLNFSVAKVGNNLVLQYTASSAPTVVASSTPATVVRNQSVAISATVTPGTGSVTNVQVDASQIGGSATSALVPSATPNVYTNTFVIPANLTTGVKLLTVVAKATSGLNSPGVTLTNTVVVTNEIWTGAGANNNWTTGSNWNLAAPALSGDSVTFGGTTRLNPDMDNNYSLTGLSFASGAGSFTVGSTGGNTLTLAAGTGIVNNSANPQVVNVPVTQATAQTYNAASGALIINQAITKGGNLVTVTGAANTVFGGTITDSGSLYKRGSGTLTITNTSNWDLSQANSGGFGGPLMAQAGVVAFKGSTHTVNGELVIGGVVANGGAGNDAKLVVDAATFNVTSWLSIGRGNGIGGVSSDLVLTNGAIVTAANASAGFNGGNGANKPKGSVSLHGNSSLTVNGDFHIAEAAGSVFDINVNDTSTLSYGNFMDLAIGFGGTVANMNINGGTLNGAGDIFIGHWGDGTATLNVNSGAVNIGTIVERWLFMGYWDRVNGQINVSGGALNFYNNSKVRMARNINNGGANFSHTINQTGGAVTFFSDAGTTVGGAGLIDLQFVGAASGTATYNLSGGTLAVPGIMSSATTGNRFFNFNGGTLKAAVDSVTLLDLGAGNAHAYVRTNGAIIDTDGKSVIIASALEHFPGESTDGGLTKKGAGTLTLNGANTYVGNTRVNAGTLQLAQATLASSSSVTISNSAVLQLDFATTNQINSLILNGVSQAAGVYNNANLPTYITGTGSLLVQPIASNPTNVTVSVSGNTLSLSWPTSHLGWILQQQVNGLSTGLSNNWVDVAGTASITATNITINPASGAVFYRLRKP